MTNSKRRNSLLGVAIAGAVIAWAFSRFTGENVNAVTLLVAALAFYYLGGKFYSAFLAEKVLKLDDANITPAHRLRDDCDHIPYRRWTLFGMHFAWIAGPGPLIGPTMAAQFGYFPGFMWIVLGAVLMGCVQDMVILTFSTRRDGMSLARMIKSEISPVAGLFASGAVLFILVVLLAVLALTVVKALAGSPWSTFTIAASIPIAFIVGWYMTRLRPGHEGQATAIGVFLLILATAGGHFAKENAFLSHIFSRTEMELSFCIIIYGFMAAALPAWMLLAPRDNISTYLKIGTVFLLAIGILIARPVIQMPAVAHYSTGTGPVIPGGIFPFCFIIIACGAISGFHSLISSGVTPRFVDKESDIRTIGYGAMLTESFVGVMALIAAVSLVPGVYLAMNTATKLPVEKAGPQKDKMSLVNATAITDKISSLGPLYKVTPQEMDALAEKAGEKSLYGRVGGAPSLAIGMASIFSGALPNSFFKFWFHFAIMFEAVFILTVLDSGTRVVRFVINEMLQDWRRMRKDAHSHAEIPRWLTSGLAVVGWGLLLFWGIIDKEGGTTALFKLFGVANQMLAVIALTLATAIMLKRHRAYAWITVGPMLVVGTVTISAAVQMIFSSNPRIGALAAAKAADTAVKANNATLQAVLAGLLLLSVLAVLTISLMDIFRTLRTPRLAAAGDLPASGGA